MFQRSFLTHFRTSDLKQQFQKDCHFINSVAFNSDAVLSNDLKLFSNDMASKFKKKKLPDTASFQKDVERANQHIQRYQEVIQDLQSRICEQNRGISVELDEQSVTKLGNYYSLSNLQQEHVQKIQQVGEGINRFYELVSKFYTIYQEELAPWITAKPLEDKSSLEILSTEIPKSLNMLEKVSDYFLKF